MKPKKLSKRDDIRERTELLVSRLKMNDKVDGHLRYEKKGITSAMMNAKIHVATGCFPC